MSLWNLVANTVEGAAQVAVAPVKVGVGVLTAPLDDGDTIVSGLENTIEGAQKVGSTKEHK